MSVLLREFAVVSLVVHCCSMLAEGSVLPEAARKTRSPERQPLPTPSPPEAATKTPSPKWQPLTPSPSASTLEAASASLQAALASVAAAEAAQDEVEVAQKRAEAEADLLRAEADIMQAMADSTNAKYASILLAMKNILDMQMAVLNSITSKVSRQGSVLLEEATKPPLTPSSIESAVEDAMLAVQMALASVSAASAAASANASSQEVEAAQAEAEAALQQAVAQIQVAQANVESIDQAAESIMTYTLLSLLLQQLDAVAARLEALMA